ncbi:MAG: Na+/H+ antiporter NhaA [Planctomycetia bacterium]|nr:Na+/H+ antiporter NhaA [Planctomycetia bacterium]
MTSRKTSLNAEKNAPPSRLPKAPVQRWMRPLRRFLEIEAASGVVLLVCTVIALVLANTPWAGAVAGFGETHVRFGIGGWELSESLLHVVNDGLMTIFFFLVGLEIKREFVAGELRDPKKAALPVVAALGGMIAPAAIYLTVIRGGPGQAGWGIPMATDIAFVVGVMALLGPRVPLGLKIMLLSLAIADDIGAVLVIALFYSTSISGVALGLAAIGFALVFILNRIGVRRVPLYVIVGAGIWLVFFKSGVHPTVAGVLLGLVTPASAWVGDRGLLDVIDDVRHSLDDNAARHVARDRNHLLGELRVATREADSPLDRLQSALHPWVAFVIMPLFALANAGVAVRPAALGDSIAVAVAAGLVLGKPLGIVFFSWLAVRVGLARLPGGVNWKVMLGAGCLAGIGFTMSLFIAGLALNDQALDAGKVGTLTGSTTSAILGSLLLVVFLPKRSAAADGREDSPSPGGEAETSGRRRSPTEGRE